MPRLIHPDKLQAALLRLDTSKLPPARKKLLRNFALTQANPDSEAPDVVESAMKSKRRKQVSAAKKAVSAVFGDVGARGKAALEAMSDVEWEQLSDNRE